MTVKKEYENLGLIVATGENREIGCGPNLIWRIREDMKFFKSTTMDSYIIMGRKTYLTLPPKLPGRKYVVLSKDENFELESPNILHRSVEETLDFVVQEKNSPFWVIGGGIVYSNFLPYIDLMHITQVQATAPDADVFFPEYNLDEWEETLGEELYCPDNNVNYRHGLYLRKKSSRKNNINLS